MTITAKNDSHKEVKISINKWGNSGDTNRTTLKAGGSDKWDRSDERGFVMTVRKTGAEHPYYVQAKSEIVITDDSVSDRGTILRPIIQ